LEIALVLLSTPTATSSAESGVVKGVSPILSVARTPRLPALEDFTRDMDPSPELKNTFARVSGFVQRALRDGEPSTQKTDVYLAYDDENLYLAFVCFDTEPKRVRGRLLARGPEILDDDYVSVQIDDFRDQRRAYSFAANPLACKTPGPGWKARAGTTPSIRFGTRGAGAPTAGTSCGCPYPFAVCAFLRLGSRVGA
jgi:hypothetical protein